MGESGSTKGIYWYFQRVIMMKPTLKKQHREVGGGGGGEQWEIAGVLRGYTGISRGLS